MNRYEKIRLISVIPVLILAGILYFMHIDDYYINKIIFGFLTIKLLADMIYKLKSKDMRKTELVIDLFFLFFFIKVFIK